MKKVLVINGPNLNMLGKRKENHYGTLTLDEINAKMLTASSALGIHLTFFQSNIEGELINEIHRGSTFDGMILNAGAYTHYSYAIADAMEIISIPIIEVHLSNIHGREDFRQQSVLAKCCVGQISGFKEDSYILALHALDRIFKK